MSLPSENRDGFFSDGTMTAEQEQEAANNTTVSFLLNNPGIPLQLANRLLALDFTGSFEMLGLSVQEALQMDSPTLKRHINDKTGLVTQYAQQKEEETRENNKKFFEEQKAINRILF